MVQEITLDQTLHVRSQALRKGAPEETCRLSEDHMPGSFHMGYLLEGKVVGVASFYPVNYGEYAGLGYRLRLMGVLPAIQASGIGKAILARAFEKLLKMGADYVWCHARQVAFGFYEKQGFSYESDYFDVPGIGQHKIMVRPIRKGWTPS